jgi:hypothetical protein
MDDGGGAGGQDIVAPAPAEPAPTAAFTPPAGMARTVLRSSGA